MVQGSFAFESTERRSFDSPHVSTQELLGGLNLQQSQAVQHHCGPLLVLAGAGSGKTRVLTRRISYLINQYEVQPDRILAVTFTNKATQEMRERLDGLLPEARHVMPWVTTFHALGLRVLRRHAEKLGFSRYFVVYDDQDSKATVKKILKDLNIDPKEFPPANFLRMIDTLKNASIEPRFEGEQDPLRRQVAKVYQRYTEALEQSDAMDFNDLLHNTLKLFTSCPDVLRWYQNHLDFILVDEFQDTNKIQYQLIRLLAGEKRNLFVVGDDDQSIYAFRGATVRNLLEFEKDYPETLQIKLEQNYRSTGTILDAAHEVIRHNHKRKSKKLWTDGGKGEQIFTFLAANEGQEAEFIAKEIQNLLAGQSLNEVAIFYRTNAQSRAIEEALVSRRIPYRIYGGLKFYDRKEVKDVLAYLRLIVNPRDEQALVRVVNTPPRGIGKKAIEDLAATMSSLGSESSVMDAVAIVAQTNGKIRLFHELWRQLTGAAQQLPLGELIAQVLDKIEYVRFLQKTAEGDLDARIENLQELQSIARSFEEMLELEGVEASRYDIIQQFLERAALTSGDDPPNQGAEQNSDFVSLMTLHLAKGLEFKTVFFCGLEEGILPHYRSLENDDALAEERRLCYVGITRAKKRLYLTRAQRRGMFASHESGGLFREACRFLQDIPDGLLTHRSSDIRQNYYHEEIALRHERRERNPQNEQRYEGGSAASKGARVVRQSSGIPVIRKAEELLKETKAKVIATGPVVPLTDLSSGKQVHHNVFGKGTVKEVEMNSSDPAQSKVTVHFETLNASKRLVYKFARLQEIS
jgi:DNA helicase II / ATP-dependent DNA helicase PcrA